VSALRTQRNRRVDSSCASQFCTAAARAAAVKFDVAAGGVVDAAAHGEASATAALSVKLDDAPSALSWREPRASRTAAVLDGRRQKRNPSDGPLSLCHRAQRHVSAVTW
jgi:hypothetical protein